MVHLKRYLTLVNFWRLLLLLLCLYSMEQLTIRKSPAQIAAEIEKTTAKQPRFKDHLNTGMWYGAVARASIAGLLLITSLAWTRKRTSESHLVLSLKSAQESALSTRAFFALLALLLLGALTMRLPRMPHSFWGDEAAAIVTYVHGHFKPVDKEDLQGKMKFDQPTWDETLYGASQGPNNHVLFSLASRLCLKAWRDIHDLPHTAFTEWVVRIPPLIAGLASIAGIALLLRIWGAPSLGLLTATVMALHPWHIKYSAEARGYTLALAILPVLLLTLTYALESNRWRHWLAFAGCEFLILYSWPGISYAVAGINVAAAVLMLLQPDRVATLSRWVTANLLAAMVFITLYAPHLPQIVWANDHYLWMKGLPMNAEWFHNVLAAPFAGIPYHEVIVSNPSELSWQRFLRNAPLLTSMGFSLLLLTALTGVIALWRKNRPLAALITSVFPAAVLCVLHFKYVLKDELRIWYLIYLLPGLSIVIAVGLQSLATMLAARLKRNWSLPITLVMLGLIAAAWFPIHKSLIIEPEEDFRGAATLVRDSLEDSTETKSKTRIYTCWLWRSSTLYDPRGDIHVRDAPEMRRSYRIAKENKGQLHVVVGYRELAEAQNADVLAMLDNPFFFEKIKVFPARNSLHTLEVYRMK
ncbi:hypothetical protein BH11VER1_BH11VER1_15790 [soil metagenome]